MVAERVGGGGHGHRDAVMAEAHADVADDEALFQIEGLALAGLQPDVRNAQQLVQAGVGDDAHGVINLLIFKIKINI